MKISKSILSAMAVGILAVGGTSCSSDATDIILPVDEVTKCDENCEIDHDHDSQTKNTWHNCPGCGMG